MSDPAPREVPLARVRNIGIAAHIDAGKTTTTERFLYYAGRIHRIGEIDEGTTQMDWMVQERERGITITSAATTVHWHDHRINIIDTPGHVDFTIEVERCLKVLDGAVIVLCAVGGVEPQTETVWRQADRYRIPRLAFINKLDRLGADFYRVVKMMAESFSQVPLPVQLPIGTEDEHEGVIDLVENVACVWQSDDLGATYETRPVPEDRRAEVEAYRHRLVDTLTTFDERLLEKYVGGEDITPDDLRAALRKGTLELTVVPVFCGSAFRNKGVQKLIDGVVDYLPSPLDVPPLAGTNPRTGEAETRKPDPKAPFSGLIFKLATDPHRGLLSYLRVYSGTVKAGEVVWSAPDMKRVRLAKLLMMHANRPEEVAGLSAGEIGAVIGLKESRTGQTLANLAHPIAYESIEIPEPVVFIAVEPSTRAEEEKLAATLEILALEDPTFRRKVDDETGQLILSGMGELHLDILIDRLKRDYKVGVHSGKPQVSYRETVTGKAAAEGRFVRQTGGAGHFAVIKLAVEPCADGNETKNEIKHGALPAEFVKAVEEGIRDSLEAGVLAGYEVTGTRVRILDGKFHEEDSHDVDFKVAAATAFRDAFLAAGPTFLEPLMELEIVAPEQYLGGILGDITARNGRILHIEPVKGHQIVRAEVPLANTFGYATALRSLTQGRATSSMQFKTFRPVDRETRVRLYPLFAETRQPAPPTA
ncbi:MAG TPA: elongation factor G [candidate division WOR-3 bacterium]|uniref:Elongation factor G n=1 Tax=candidate division WOR-3 bacterium TaxID=2052148 RepID=A0A7V0T533_UNCW3|nr:elongation factor G [candidate division WOR-3 bacterium]